MAVDGRLIEENIRERRFEVDHNFDGWRLDKFLANRIDGMSRSLAGRVAKGGDVEVIPRRKIKAGTRLRNEDLVILREELPPEVVQDDEVSILYEDEAMLVLYKPAGMLVHETATVRLNTITHYLERQGFDEAEPVHRLDRETSGALVCAREHQFAAPLCELFAGDDPHKVYRALVVDPSGKWSPGQTMKIDIPLGFDDDSDLPHKVWRGELEAQTRVEALGRRQGEAGELADLKVTIETGRQHQIRVHLAMQDTPVAGDKLYEMGDEFFKNICDHPEDEMLLSKLRLPRQALHAWRISITHPLKEHRIEVQAPLPQIWSAKLP